jgi:hypothetical protein
VCYFFHQRARISDEAVQRRMPVREREKLQSELEALAG